MDTDSYLNKYIVFINNIISRCPCLRYIILPKIYKIYKINMPLIISRKNL